MKKNGDANNEPLFIILLGALFLCFGGTFFYLMLSKSSDVLLLIVCALLMVCGALFLVYGTIRAIMMAKYKKVLKDENAYVTTANFESAERSGYSSKESNMYVEARHFNKIYYNYIDENGISRSGKSTLSYSKAEVEYLERKGYFSIKCKGKVSVIIEEFPEGVENYNK